MQERAKAVGDHDPEGTNSYVGFDRDNVLAGAYLVVEQVADDIRTDLPAVLRRVETAKVAGEITAMKLALEDLARHLGNIQFNAKAAVTLCVLHINRRPRP